MIDRLEQPFVGVSVRSWLTKSRRGTPRSQERCHTKQTTKMSLKWIQNPKPQILDFGFWTLDFESKLRPPHTTQNPFLGHSNFAVHWWIPPSIDASGSRMLIDNRVRKGPYFHLSQEQGRSVEAMQGGALFPIRRCKVPSHCVWGLSPLELQVAVIQ